MRSPSSMSRPLDIYLEGRMVSSPDGYDSDSDSDGAHSDVTIDDVNSYPSWGFGYPLQRMVRGSDEEDASSFYRSSFSSCSSESGSSISTSSSVIYDM